MPAKKYEYNHVIQSYNNGQWGDETFEPTNLTGLLNIKDAKKTLKEYKSNLRQPVRMVFRREKIA